MAMPEFSMDISYPKKVLFYYAGNYSDEEGLKATSLLGIVCFVMFVTILLHNLFTYLAARFHTKIKANGIRNIRGMLYRKMVSLQTGFFSEKNKGDLISRMTNDMMRIEGNILHSIPFWTRDPIYIVVVFGFLVVSWPTMTLIILTAFIPGGIIIGEITKRLKKSSILGQEELGKILSVIDETLMGMRVIKAFNAENLVTKRFGEKNNRHRKLMKSIGYKRELASPLSQLLSASLVIYVVVYYGGLSVIDGTSPLGEEEFIAYVLLYTQIISPGKNMTKFFSNIQEGIASADRVFEVLNKKITIKDSPDAKTVDGFNNKIVFENVSFAYDNEDILKNINLEIEKGKTIAIVGPSGGGKSTMVNLLPRLHDVKSGRILIDGVDTRDIKLASVRNLMGMVTQESILFNDTVFNNISFSKPRATREEVEAAAKAAHAHDFIMQLDKGYETEVGDMGMKLSGGQRQRVTIARALLKNPPILLLDEATSALDSEAEHLVQEALNNLMKSRTSIVIAHRLSTIQNADEIIVIDKGEIAERGTHAELIKSNGIYRKFTDLQSV